MSQTSQKYYSAEEAYALLASDSESVSDESDEFIAFVSTSSSSSSSDEGPPVRRPRRLVEAAPQISEPVWTPPPENFEPQIPEFVGNPGIKIDTADLTEIDFFKVFFTEDLIHGIVSETNLYAQQFLDQNPASSFARWTPVDPSEMRTYFGLVLHMGLLKKPKIRQYWSTEILYSTRLHRMAMTRTRFEAIQKFLHYNDNAKCPPRDDPTYDRLYKVRPVIDHFNAKFSEVYVPDKCVAIDESLVHYKGRLRFRQYLPSKRARYGIKMYKLCESTSGYTHKFRVYEGKDSRIEPPECPPPPRS